MANVQIVLSALNNASSSITKVKADIKQLGDSGKTAEGGVKGLGAALGGAWTTALAAAAAIAAVGAAIGKTYEIAKEGAQLDYAEDRFNNLAIAAGTAADVLLGDMREATKGMMSDAELVASGADLMALGLAKSHDEVVRLTAVAGALNMNMNQLVLTLTNQTTMRFDALGVSVDGFSEKVKGLEAAGMSANDAFKEAFLQQAEEQILKVGNAADSSIGAFQRMESAQANYFNALKQDLVEAGTWWAQFWEGVYNDKIADRTFTELISQAKALGINTSALEEAVLVGRQWSTEVSTGTVYLSDAGKATAESIELNKAAVEALGEQVKYQSEMNLMRSRGTNANYEYSGSVNLLGSTSASAAEDAKILQDQLKSLEDELANANLELDIAVKTFRETVGSDLVKGLRDAGLEGAELEKRLEILDELFGTTYVAEYRLELGMSDLLKELINDPEGFKDKYSEFEAKFMVDDADVVAAKEKVDEVQTAIDILTSKPYTIEIDVIYNDSGFPIPRATGGSVSAGTPYLWQEYGYRGEKFVPAQNGYILSRSDASRAVANAQAMSALRGGAGADAREIANAVKQGVKEAMRDTGGGKIYNLTMPTSSNPADVRTAFELMEAWA